MKTTRDRETIDKTASPSSQHDGTRFVSLFSGALGLDLGLEKCGFHAAVCVENDTDAAKTIRRNRPNTSVVDRSIEDVDAQQLRCAGRYSPSEDVELLAGGPPCQSFSVFGNRLGIADARGQLIFEFIRMVEELNPRTFIIENVRGMLSMSLVPRTSEHARSGLTNHDFLEKGSLLKEIVAQFKKLSYHVDCFVVNAVNYGAPQNRERVFLIGNRLGVTAAFPAPRFSNRPIDRLPPFRTLGDVIGPESGFVDPDPSVMNFSRRKLAYLAMIPPGGNWRSLPEPIQKQSMGRSWYLKGGRSAYWRKLSFAFPSPTVVTMPNHAGTSMCHPNELRAITVGEAAAIQEFPSDWQFEGTTASKFRQIGNAVPTRLGWVAGEVLRDLLDQRHRVTKPLREPGYTETHIRPHVRTRTFYKNGETFAGDYSYYGNSRDRDRTEDGQLEFVFADDASH